MGIRINHFWGEGLAEANLVSGDIRRAVLEMEVCYDGLESAVLQLGR